ncbi:hypothetical protein DFH07DRAFT_286756 [Mycena maculata]|uniref:DUF6699 domain-containing protein n=1 Tax=Mycena maculata TaxID=230809 RepID=A0AAD7HKX3_9AGAR|nr:hypothetical protein DFH07DRAFT_286756 [Mycena maculata]
MSQASFAWQFTVMSPVGYQTAPFCVVPVYGQCSTCICQCSAFGFRLCLTIILTAYGVVPNKYRSPACRVLYPTFLHQSLGQPDISYSPVHARRCGATTKSLRWLEEPATSTHLDEVEIVLSSNWAPWSTFVVRRKDGRTLLVGDVLQAIHLHLTRPLSAQETRALDLPSWPYKFPSLRFDCLNGCRLFSGLTYLGGNRLGLNLR